MKARSDMEDGRQQMFEDVGEGLLEMGQEKIEAEVQTYVKEKVPVIGAEVISCLATTCAKARGEA